MSIGHLVSQPIFSPLASFVPRLQSNQTVLLGLPSQDHSCSGSLRRVCQLNPTDFATSLTLLHSFSKSRKILFGVWWKSSVTQQLLCFHHFFFFFFFFFRSDDQWAHLRFGYVEGSSVYS